MNIHKFFFKGELGFAEEIIVVAVILAISAFLIFWISLFFKKLSKWITVFGEKNFKAITIKKYQILEQKQIMHSILFMVSIIKYLLFAFVLFLMIPLIFGIFPETQSIAETLWGYFLYPVKKIFFGIINYIPKLITVIVILFFVRYVLKMLKFFCNGIESGKLVIKGFYPEWAKPTYLLLKYMIYAFTIALIFPYLPNSDSQVFQGVSIFVGLIVSLGSSSAIGNLVAGLVITYMRPFHIGDRIRIGDSEGIVVEKTAVVVRIQTDKKEFITFPNITILTSNITNYNYSNETGNGLLVHTQVTYGYDTDWRKIHELLINAAKKTSMLESTPEPFVLQKALDDFYCVYEINAYTKEIAKLPIVYSELNKNIQDVFKEAGLNLTAPHYDVITNINGDKPKE